MGDDSAFKIVPIYTDKRTGRLYVEFQYKGTRVKERLPEGISRKDAEKVELKLRSDLMFQSHGIETREAVMTFERFIAEIFGPVADSWGKTRYDKTVMVVRAATPYFKGKPMRAIKAADIERFKLSRINLPTMHDTTRKPATVEREMSIISSIFSMAVANDVIDYNPCSRVKKLYFDNVQNKVLRREDESRFFANMHGEWSTDVCKMALYTGLRQNDILNLSRFQVDLASATVTLIQGKTKRRAIVPLNSVAFEILDRRMREKKDLLFPSPVTGKETGSVRHSMRRACERAKIPVLTIRDLRRTYATRLIENGADMVSVAQNLGHTGVRMMPRYVRSIEARRKAAESLVNPAKIIRLAEKG